jgi:hypothetical protein
MKTHLFLSTLVLLISLTFYACDPYESDNYFVRGVGPAIEQELILSDFTKIDLKSSFNAIISQGPVQKVVAVGNENIIERLNTNVTDQQWDMNFDMGCYSNFELIIYITVPSIEEVKLSGSGNIEMMDFNQDNDLVVTIRGSGNFALNNFESSENLEANLMSSGIFTANKEVNCFKTLSVNTSGSGNFKGFLIKAKKCIVKSTGSGKCFVYAEEKLDASILGSGDIEYKGNPIIDIIDNGSGNLKRSK